MRKSSGQVVILLLLIMVVALAIGLSTIGRSILEVSTSRKSEDSSRAFSAAEAGIEKAIKQNENNIGGGTVVVGAVNLNNQTTTSVNGYGLPLAGNALGWSSRTKSDFAQFWLANPGTLTQSYTGTTFDLYFGDSNPKIGYFSSALPESDPLNPINDQPAIEVNIIYWDGSKYQVIKKYYDSYKTIANVRQPRNGFNDCSSYPSSPVNTNNDSPVDYYCQIRVPPITDTPNTITNSASNFPVMVRVRLLYTNIAHPIALKASSGSTLPLQANVYKSSGTSGDVKRTLETAVYRAVMPQFFDYAVFSAADFAK